MHLGGMTHIVKFCFLLIKQEKMNTLLICRTFIIFLFSVSSLNLQVLIIFAEIPSITYDLLNYKSNFKIPYMIRFYYWITQVKLFELKWLSVNSKIFLSRVIEDLIKRFHNIYQVITICINFNSTPRILRSRLDLW